MNIDFLELLLIKVIDLVALARTFVALGFFILVFLDSLIPLSILILR